MTRHTPISTLFSSLIIFSLLFSVFPSSQTYAAGPSVFINEIHYDNADADAGEAVEIAGPAGTDLTGWSLALYNGSGGAVYGTIALVGTIPDHQNGYGTLDFSFAGIQNGAPDGLALVDSSSAVVQFLSYEGVFTAVGGPADGMVSVDIGVSEGSSTPVGDSLQLIGTGTDYDDFSWTAPAANTFGAVNTGQVFEGSTPPTPTPTPPPPPDSAPTVAATTPANGVLDVALDADLAITFSEAVDVAPGWFEIDCTSSGILSAAVSGGPTTYTLTPDAVFANSEICEVTVFAVEVTDQDDPQIIWKRILYLDLAPKRI